MRQADRVKSGSSCHAGRLLYLCGFGTRGNVGVIGMILGGVFGGRLAACFANASLTKELTGKEPVVGEFDFLYGMARIVNILSA